METVRLTEFPMPVEGLVVGQSPAPGTKVPGTDQQPGLRGDDRPRTRLRPPGRDPRRVAAPRDQEHVPPDPAEGRLLPQPQRGLAARPRSHPLTLTRPATRRAAGTVPPENPAASRASGTTNDTAGANGPGRQGEVDLPNSSQNSGRPHPRN